MSNRIDGEAFKAWRKGMQEAERVIEEEKTKWLQSLTPEESIKIYLDLKELAKHNPNQPERSEFVERLSIVYQRYMEAYNKKIKQEQESKHD